VNAPAARQTGETCVTVKTIRAPLGSQNVSVVRRCAAGPLAAIQGRELRSRVIDASRPLPGEPDAEPEDDDPELVPPPAPPAGEEDVADPPPDDEDVPVNDAAPPVTVPVDGTPLPDGAEGTVGVGAGAGTGGGSGRVGTGSEGTETVGEGSVTGGGDGTTSAKAAPAPAAVARTPAAIAKARVLLPPTFITWITRLRRFRMRAK
jgi:hypothetical protein